MTTTVTTPSQDLSLAQRVAAPHREISVVALCVIGAALMVTSGAIHLHLWNDFYRHIHTGHLNVLFMFQWILCFVGAAALLGMRNLLAAVAGALLLAGTFVGYLIARYHHGGLFGFYLGPTFSSWEATWSMISEIAGTVVLLVTAAVMSRSRAA
jgi:tryptophan-rich sensory protein